MTTQPPEPAPDKGITRNVVLYPPEIAAVRQVMKDMGTRSFSQAVRRLIVVGALELLEDAE